ncbi:glutamate synthase large subunit [Haematospirillum sp. 15-248]|uniref:glutamate synthase large subunit n=1 Tax=Haematospirillum sp. 15-248 TaxID=2723107 RepID=UPI00143A3FE8|nr:glutamate synthase large subunit [Haematospirillum sp. 15-248]NKD87779.1 glutamate synthase large subunit [Haematospirillum sp. 15-248]
MGNQSVAETGKPFPDDWHNNVRTLEEAHLYFPLQEHDACGVGLVAALDGKPRRQVVEAGISALKVLFHRGAVDADGKTGDGAGIHVAVPQTFFKAHVERIGHKPLDGVMAVGMIFLPKNDMLAQERCRMIVEAEILRCGYGIYGWRQVPVDIDVIGEKANATRPEIEQIMIANTRNVPEQQFETDLYVLRRRMEAKASAENIAEFYVCSLSCRSVIYKGMFLAEQLDTFYPDLADERFESPFAIYHQRYSTNTFPTWRLAQPFRMLAHNGEINTLSGNINWMRAHETRLESPVFGARVRDLKPVIQPGGSDSAALDNVFELLVRAGRPAPAVKAMMIPESLSSGSVMPDAHRHFFRYSNCVMEPWDGPAAVCAYDGRWVIAGLDRNGLRPLRYTITGDDLLIVGSETGMVRIDEASVRAKGRVGPGQCIGIDLLEGRFYGDDALKTAMASRAPFGAWTSRMTHLDSLIKGSGMSSPTLDAGTLCRRQLAHGMTLEDMELILAPMIEEAKEAIGSMGDDTPLAVLSDHYRGLHVFFRQNFSQVTNPPIDPLRETRVMSLGTRLGNLGNILDEDPSQCDILQIESPVLTNAEFWAMCAYMGDAAAFVDCTFDVHGGEHALREAVRRIQNETEDAVRGGCTHVILTDESASADRAPMPMILAAGAVHTWLIRQKLRTFTSLNVRSGECLDTHSIAVLIGVGATTVNAWLAEEAIHDRVRRGLLGGISLEQALRNFRKAQDDGLRKIMSKMGISVVSSYRGGLNFEAVGLSRALVAEFFPGMPSRISGIGMAGIQKMVLEQHVRAWKAPSAVLPVGGLYRYRRGSGETHGFEGTLIHMLQMAVTREDYALYQRYTRGVRALPPISLRDLLDFRRAERPLPPDEVESVTQLRRRFVTPAMSLGALSEEAHGTLNIAMNRIGAKSDSGEGGEVPERYRPRPNGDNANSAIKQVASGRFGVTAEYLNQCREIEIKVAQGAKPGEGGQLPGFKVTAQIAALRHSTPGVTLISPPPHHDIYSIEDLAQLIYDLKQINPKARVVVKLVSRSGIGTIAAGVAKAKADVIHISGHAGGTGASPMTSIRYAGLPWELGLSEVHQVLTLNRLRHRVLLRTDGGIKTGRDVVVAAILGAEEFGVGTASLIAMGCIMVRQCHSNTCPVGVCTQDEALRAKFGGTPEKVVNLFSFMAEEVREILAELGFRTLNEIIGRTDLLYQVSRGAWYLDDLDLNSLLVKADTGGLPTVCAVQGRNEVDETLDARMIEDARSALEDGEKMQLTYHVQNTHRAVGTGLSHRIVTRYGMKGLQPGHITVRLRGSAGQSLGAFAVQGLKLEVFGDANDYVGKGLSGGAIVVRPPVSSPLLSQDNTIIGNTVLYGATAGTLFAAGQAGERFAVRNSGAVAVIEGCGSNGCEYMTGGEVVILGPVGPNFAAGMTGGMAYVLCDDSLDHLLNPDSVICQRIEMDYYANRLKELVRQHTCETGSRFAEKILAEWHCQIGNFWQIVPREMVMRLDMPVSRRLPEACVSA